MREIIKNRELVRDPWTYLLEGGDLPAEGRVILPWQRWRDEVAPRGHDPQRFGIAADGDVDPDELGAHASVLELIALRVPKFTDGRHFSTARLLRERYDYRGELRAFGDVVPDQVFYMHRVGYDAFELPPGPRQRAALAALQTFSVTYQGAVRGRPLHRARA